MDAPASPTATPYSPRPIALDDRAERGMAAPSSDDGQRWREKLEEIEEEREEERQEERDGHVERGEECEGLEAEERRDDRAGPRPDDSAVALLAAAAASVAPVEDTRGVLREGWGGFGDGFREGEGDVEERRGMEDHMGVDSSMENAVGDARDLRDVRDAGDGKNEMNGMYVMEEREERDERVDRGARDERGGGESDAASGLAGLAAMSDGAVRPSFDGPIDDEIGRADSPSEGDDGWNADGPGDTFVTPMDETDDRNAFGGALQDDASWTPGEANAPSDVSPDLGPAPAENTGARQSSGSEGSQPASISLPVVAPEMEQDVESAPDVSFDLSIVASAAEKPSLGEAEASHDAPNSSSSAPVSADGVDARPTASPSDSGSLSGVELAPNPEAQYLTPAYSGAANLDSHSASDPPGSAVAQVASNSPSPSSAPSAGAQPALSPKLTFASLLVSPAVPKKTSSAGSRALSDSAEPALAQSASPSESSPVPDSAEASNSVPEFLLSPRSPASAGPSSHEAVDGEDADGPPASVIGRFDSLAPTLAPVLDILKASVTDSASNAALLGASGNSFTGDAKERNGSSSAAAANIASDPASRTPPSDVDVPNIAELSAPARQSGTTLVALTSMPDTLASASVVPPSLPPISDLTARPGLSSGHGSLQLVPTPPSAASAAMSIAAVMSTPSSSALPTTLPSAPVDLNAGASAPDLIPLSGVSRHNTAANTTVTMEGISHGSGTSVALPPGTTNGSLNVLAVTAQAPPSFETASASVNYLQGPDALLSSDAPISSNPTSGSGTPAGSHSPANSAPVFTATATPPVRKKSLTGTRHAPSWGELLQIAEAHKNTWERPPRSKLVETDIFYVCRIISKIPNMGLTQSFISQKSGVSQSTLSQYLRGVHQGKQGAVEARLNAFLEQFCAGLFDEFIPPPTDRPKSSPTARSAAPPRHAPLVRPSVAAQAAHAAQAAVQANSTAAQVAVAARAVGGGMQQASFVQGHFNQPSHQQLTMERMAAAAFHQAQSTYHGGKSRGAAGPAFHRVQGANVTPTQSAEAIAQRRHAQDVRHRLAAQHAQQQQQKQQQQQRQQHELIQTQSRIQQQQYNIQAQRQLQQQKQQLEQKQFTDQAVAHAQRSQQVSAQQGMYMSSAQAVARQSAAGVYAGQSSQPVKRPRVMYGAPVPSNDSASVTARDAAEKAFHVSKAASWSRVNGTSEPLLLPIEVFVELDGHVLHMFTQWDVNERVKSPESVGADICRCRSLPETFGPAIAALIRRRLFDAGIIPPPPPLADGQSSGGDGENLRFIKIVCELDDDGQTQILRDSFEWDIGAGGDDVWNCPETFSQTLCSDAGISQKHAAAVSRVLRRELSRAHAIAYGDAETRACALAEVPPSDPVRKALAVVENCVTRQLSPDEARVQRREENEVMVRNLFVKPLLTEVDIELKRRAADQKLAVVAEVQRKKAEEEFAIEYATTEERLLAFSEAKKERKESENRVLDSNGIDIRPYTNLKLGFDSNPAVWVEGLSSRKKAGGKIISAAGDSPSQVGTVATAPATLSASDAVVNSESPPLRVRVNLNGMATEVGRKEDSGKGRKRSHDQKGGNEADNIEAASVKKRGTEKTEGGVTLRLPLTAGGSRTADRLAVEDPVVLRLPLVANTEVPPRQ